MYGGSAVNKMKQSKRKNFNGNPQQIATLKKGLDPARVQISQTWTNEFTASGKVGKPLR